MSQLNPVHSLESSCTSCADKQAGIFRNCLFKTRLLFLSFDCITEFVLFYFSFHHFVSPTGLAQSQPQYEGIQSALSPLAGSVIFQHTSSQGQLQCFYNQSSLLRLYS